MKTVANKQKICDVLMEAAKTDKDIVALCSDSRGSGSFTPFAATYPEQFVFYLPEVMNSVKLMLHIQIPM